MSNTKSRFQKIINIKNRKASYEFEFIDTYKAGIMLKGTEIKSLREGKASLQEAYAYFKKDELYLKSMNIAEYTQGTYANHEPTRERKLLLNKRELEKLKANSNEKGLTIIPTRIFINDRGMAKVEIALAKGKKIHDKRDSIKEKDMKRELSRLKY